ncbi:MAG: DMT family transporter, partial [Desulfobacterales bacterium]
VVSMVAVVGGLAVTLQGQFMGIMDQNLGTKESVFITYGSGGLAAILLFLLLPGNNLRNWSALPWYVFSSGLFGLIIVGSIGYVLPRMGLARGFTLMIAVQFILAALIDHYGFFGAALRPLELTRISGLIIMLFGVWLVMR